MVRWKSVLGKIDKVCRRSLVMYVRFEFKLKRLGTVCRERFECVCNFNSNGSVSEMKKIMKREYVCGGECFDVMERRLCQNVTDNKYNKYNGVKNVSCFIWLLFREGLYGERFKLGDGVGDEEDNNQRIYYGLIITLPSPTITSIPGLEEPHTPPIPHDEDEREPMFIQPHDPDYVPEPMYLEYIPLKDEHVLLAEEQPLPPIDSPIVESPRHVAKSDPEEDPKEYQDDETEDGPVDYPMDGGDNGDDDDSDSSGDDTDDEDEDEEDEMASTQALIDAVTAALPSPPLPPPLYIPPPVDRKDDIPEIKMPPRKRLWVCQHLNAEARRRGIGEVWYGIKDTWVDLAEAVPEIAPTTVGEDRIAHQETILIVEEEAYAAREAWAHLIGLSKAVHYELQTQREQADLLALREQTRRARQPGEGARVPNHQDAPRDADSHI
nr:hypothetical protein [Tanacetum cinerariifolium]